MKTYELIELPVQAQGLEITINAVMCNFCNYAILVMADGLGTYVCGECVDELSGNND